MRGIKRFKGTKKLITAGICLLIMLASCFSAGAVTEGERVGIAAGVNIRTGPGTGNTVIKTTAEYTYATVLGEALDIDRDLWYNVLTDDGTSGYVNAPFVEGVIEHLPFNAENRVMITETVNVRSRPSLTGDPIASVWPCSLECLGKVENTPGDIWYHIITPGGLEGYVNGAYVAEYTYTPDPAFEEELKAFPKSYRAGLRYLHTRHPNWKFYADNLTVNFDNAVKNETGKKLIADVYTSLPEDWRGTRTETTVEPGYRPASEKAVAYFISPQFFICEKTVFMFMQQSFDPLRQSAEGLKGIISGSFLDSEEYVEIIMKAAAESKVSPYVIAGIILQEQSFSGSALCTGNYPGYEGYYNFFNFGASGSTAEQIVETGLGYAAVNGWNSPEAAITGGATQYAKGYISANQDTYYYTDFNLINKNWNYQYATSIHDQINKAVNISGAYTNAEASAVFRLPVFTDSDMGNDLPHEHVYDEGIIIKQPTAAETGIKEYTCTVCGFKLQETIPALTPSLKKGDINGDGAIDTIDGALLRMYFLKLRGLEKDQLERADINGDGAVDTIDGALLRMHFLKLKELE